MVSVDIIVTLGTAEYLVTVCTVVNVGCVVMADTAVVTVVRCIIVVVGIIQLQGESVRSHVTAEDRAVELSREEGG